MRIILLILLCFVGITVVVCGGIMMLYPDGVILQLQHDTLKPTPFKTFFIPGLVLLLCPGLSCSIAAAMVLLNRKQWYRWCLTGGVMITGWIIVQMILLQTINALQLLYSGAGLFILLLAYQLKGKWAV
ncbi:hypothetical protein [Agriterribacter sp.]|uniref:hypothetical protein n=1 Tax=Agriterribacter sp. TaxID=2821509 RepID=UPI002BEA4F59|nr:hypothetical protein [Agriterribacter sp.]HRO46285.1 hypothetical protein [Agriterribacter sp.]HRQ18526.1 hypothetical protein [Agriterribacter sp.]